ncbi:ABC transporter permease [Priestia sp. OVS21]|nr:ABC transporter permease [Priestia sp. OVS21]
MPANTFTKVLFPSEQFDLNNEYDTSTGNFIPKQDGIYSFNAGIEFFPAPLTIESNNLELLIRVNGTSVALESLEINEGEGVITVSTIQQLQAGDTVEVLARSFRSGNINGNFDSIPLGGPDQTRFEGTLITQIEVD